MRKQLLRWYALHKRDLPWRDSPDTSIAPYAIWVSEIMLQQTRAAVVAERYKSFLAKFPTIAALAAADEQSVLALWSGLGYYNRARNLHKAARFIVDELNGQMPHRAADLKKLPGIGSYTSAAIASIAHGEPVAVVDGNVERVVARLHGLEVDKTAATKKKIESLANHFVSPAHPGDFNQAMMELGATLCLPRNPRCAECPLVDRCLTRGEHKTVARAPMQSKTIAHALATRTRAGQTEILLAQRPATETVMPGLWELPQLKRPGFAEAHLAFAVRHAIMQVNYTVRIRAVTAAESKTLLKSPAHSRWIHISDAATMALTGLARKVLKKSHLI
jgi:A/G-specific adenine glycosylase